jgi:hypothetical protein
MEVGGGIDSEIEGRPSLIWITNPFVLPDGWRISKCGRSACGLVV